MSLVFVVCVWSLLLAWSNHGISIRHCHITYGKFKNWSPLQWWAWLQSMTYCKKKIDVYCMNDDSHCVLCSEVDVPTIERNSSLRIVVNIDKYGGNGSTCFSSERTRLYLRSHSLNYDWGLVVNDCGRKLLRVIVFVNQYLEELRSISNGRVLFCFVGRCPCSEWFSRLT